MITLVEAFRLTCDGCRTTTGSAHVRAEQVARLLPVGWHRDGVAHLCPGCWQQRPGTGEAAMVAGSTVTARAGDDGDVTVWVAGVPVVQVGYWRAAELAETLTWLVPRLEICRRLVAEVGRHPGWWLGRAPGQWVRVVPVGERVRLDLAGTVIELTEDKALSFAGELLDVVDQLTGERARVSRENVDCEQQRTAQLLHRRGVAS